MRSVALVYIVSGVVSVYLLKARQRNWDRIYHVPIKEARARPPSPWCSTHECSPHCQLQVPNRCPKYMIRFSPLPHWQHRPSTRPSPSGLWLPTRAPLCGSCTPGPGSSCLTVRGPRRTRASFGVARPCSEAAPKTDRSGCASTKESMSTVPCCPSRPPCLVSAAGLLSQGTRDTGPCSPFTDTEMHMVCAPRARNTIAELCGGK